MSSTSPCARPTVTPSRTCCARAIPVSPATTTRRTRRRCAHRSDHQVGRRVLRRLQGGEGEERRLQRRVHEHPRQHRPGRGAGAFEQRCLRRRELQRRTARLRVEVRPGCERGRALRLPDRSPQASVQQRDGMLGVADDDRARGPSGRGQATLAVNPMRLVLVGDEVRAPTVRRTSTSVRRARSREAPRAAATTT